MTRILVVDDTILTALQEALNSSLGGGNDTIVAIVDDDDDVREVLSGLPELVGYKAITYRSGQEFLKDAILEKVLCLVVDQKMPGMTRLDLLSQLHSRGMAIPSLLITGCIDDKIERQALDLGVMRLAEKPIQMGDFLRIVAVSGARNVPRQVKHA